MTLTEARKAAIALAKTIDDGETVVSVRREARREFSIAKGQVPHDTKLVMLVHVSWAKRGFYKRYGWDQEEGE